MDPQVACGARASSPRNDRLASATMTTDAANDACTSSGGATAGRMCRQRIRRFEQPAALCKQLARAQAQQVDGNVYVRAAGGEMKPPLATWGPAATESCVATAVSLEELRGLAGGMEAGGRQLDRTPRSVFRGIDVDRYDLQLAVPGLAGGTPEDVRKLLGWSEQEARTVGAYPFRR